MAGYVREYAPVRLFDNGNLSDSLTLTITRSRKMLSHRIASIDKMSQERSIWEVNDCRREQEGDGKYDGPSLTPHCTSIYYEEP